MKAISQSWLFCVLIFTISCNTIESKVQELAPELEAHIVKKIDSIGKNYLDNGGVQELTIAVAKKGSVLYNKGFGFIDSLKTQPVSNDNYFQMASISKLIVAT